MASNEELLVVAVGSTNPVKVRAVEAVLERVVASELLPGLKAFLVRGLNVPSGVSEQPIGEEETRRGALSRAEAVLEAWPLAAWGVGIEGGVVRQENGLHTCAWCVLLDRSGNTSAGGGLYMPLPPAIVRDLEAGIELGHATDRLYGVSNSKQAGGALGFLSKDLMSRQDAYEGIFTYALVKFLNPALYELT